ncbi:MAG: glycosyltransferase family 39 protein [Flavobacteriales bacterium]|nr:glycosyltransferase family 39 protein [Flavobacteriales bacterium]
MKPRDDLSTSSLVARVCIALLVSVLLAYSITRAITVSLSWDESWTFMHHVLPGMFYQEAYDKMGGNHHLLNVWLMWGSTRLFGESELALRLPNLLAHVMFLMASAGIALRSRNALLAIGGFLILNAHPYLLDFFSLARGYGLACGWMMLALYHALRYVSGDDRLRPLVLATASASLSALSHVIMVNFLIAFAVSLGAFIVMDGRFKPRAYVLKRLGALGTVSIAGLAIILPNALGLFGGGSLNFGCDSLWECTLLSLGGKVIYHLPYEMPLNLIIGRSLKVFAFFIALTALVAWLGDLKARLRPLALGLLTSMMCVASFLAQQILFDVPLPQTRTALFMLPLLAFTLAVSLHVWVQFRLAPVIMAVVACSLLINHQIKCINFTYAVEWKPSGELRKMLDVLQMDAPEPAPERPIVTVGIGFESSEPLHYYRHVRGLQWLTQEVLPATGDFPMFDYYIVEYDGLDRVDSAHCTLLYHSETTNSALFRDDRMRQARQALIVSEEPPPRRLIGASDELSWTVPASEVYGSSMLIGTIDVFEATSNNWLSLNLDLIRDNEIIESVDQPSHTQIGLYGQWNSVSVAIRPKHRLEPGDRIRFVVYTLYAEPAIFIGKRELRILR